MKVITTARSKNRFYINWLSILWIAAVLAAASTVRADIYQWQDDQGVIHFSNHDAPPQADLYMREPVPDPQPVTSEEIGPTERKTIDIQAIRRQVKTEVQLEEANRKLDRALDRVDDLAEAVSRGQSETAAAVQAAQQAADNAQQEADAAKYYRSEVKERVIVQTAPYPHRNRGDGIRHRKHRNPRYYDAHKKGNPYNKKWERRSKLDRHKLHRRQPRYYTKPTPILPPERTYIPKAYGIR